MKKEKYILISLILLAAIIFGFKALFPGIKKVTETPLATPSQTETDIKNTAITSPFVMPISDAKDRVTKKHFGTIVSPKNSPVSPERFTGIHTGVDFETFTSEQDSDVPIVAICSGTLLEAKFGSGYGGMMVESCTLDGSPITVVYGHIRLTSIKAKLGDKISAGEFLANLGTGFSSETDGERKHLHLGIHKGSSVDTRGYVATEKELSGWIDFGDYLK